MNAKTRKIIFYFILFLLFCFFVNETRYINKVKCLVPIESEIKIRNDMYGDGHFAVRRNGGRKHNGVDLLAKTGTPVLAARSGWVINAEQKRGMGKYVEIRHSDKLVTIYGHLSKILVKKGQRVRQGQIIGEVGKTGNANYRRMHAHLHFEIRKDKIPQNPTEYFQNANLSKN
ncbi:MAG: M23 family metallopeptidase [Candidatus Omnitrophota bacterium]